MSDVFLRVTQVVINVNIIGVRLLSSSHLKKRLTIDDFS